MSRSARTWFAAALHDVGLATITSVRFSMWPSRNDTLATRPPWRKCVVGCGDGLSELDASGGAMVSHSAANGGLPNVFTSAESAKANVADVARKCVIRRYTSVWYAGLG